MKGSKHSNQSALSLAEFAVKKFEDLVHGQISNTDIHNVHPFPELLSVSLITP